MKTSHMSFISNKSQHQIDGIMSTPGSRLTSPVLTRLNTSRSENAVDKPESSGISEEQTSERTGLLAGRDGLSRQYRGTAASTPNSKFLSHRDSLATSLRAHRFQSRNSSSPWDISSFLHSRSSLRTPRLHRSLILNEEVRDDKTWYDQFTSTDWVQDSIADGYRIMELKKREGLRGRLSLIFDAAQGWILVALIGCLTAYVAYAIDITEAAIYDLKRGYCRNAWYLNQPKCCNGKDECQEWLTWSEILRPSQPKSLTTNYLAFVLGCVAFAMIACILTLPSKTIVPSHIGSTFDENLGAVRQLEGTSSKSKSPPTGSSATLEPATTYYSAAGSGVAEVKVILSGFVLHGYLGFKTLVLKCLALIFSVASGMSLGQEGPFVHIATCIGNIACRMFSKYNLNDGKRREVLSAAAASGVAVAFGSPLGGVLFSLEEVSYYFPPKTLFRTFFCCIVAALSLKFLDPYGTGKIVIFEVRYATDWHVYELFSFALLGVLGGLAGAGFIKASRFWATTFRSLKPIKSNPWLEVLMVASTTGLLSFWNRYANLSVSELLFELASPCGAGNKTGLCPKTRDEIPSTVSYLLIAFCIKSFLTVITFGLKIPAGIYVPSMVCGGLMGRIVGHTIQYTIFGLSELPAFRDCSAATGLESCITPGVYALVAAGATMCGVTRLSVTLAVILFELTGSLEYVLPFAIGVLTAKWTADFVEPNSIYDLLIHMNSYPFMDNRNTPLFDNNVELGDITPRFRGNRIIDISISSYVRASDLRTKVNILHATGELDSGLPIICDKALVGFIPAPDLEFAIDGLDSPEEETLCLLSYTDQLTQTTNHRRWFPVLQDDDESAQHVSSSPSSVLSGDEDLDQPAPEVDFVSFVDPSPLALDVHSSMNLVYQCFSKLGLRYVCVLDAGEYRGMVHKKTFVRYLKTCENHD